MKATAKAKLVNSLNELITSITKTSMPQSTRRRQIIAMRPLVEQLAREIKHGDK